jgi:hypothetical protein
MFPPHFFGTFVAHKSLAYHTMNHDRLCNDFYYVSTFRKEDFLQKTNSFSLENIKNICRVHFAILSALCLHINVCQCGTN